MCAGLADTLTVCDTKPRLAAAFAEELKHVTASIQLEVDINSCDQDEKVSGADIILISAGEPRAPGVKMSRRDLSIQNARIVRYVSEATARRNPDAKAGFVISAGTNLESLRFRSKLAQTFEVHHSEVEGWVGGEHGDAAIPLWSTTKIRNSPADEYANSVHMKLPKDEVATYVKSVSKFVVDIIGGTEYGPAASFRDITRAITKNTNEILSVAVPLTFEGIPEPVFVGAPTRLGRSVVSSLYDSLSLVEKEALGDAAKTIFQTYQTAIQNLEQC
jgi:malate dehydrogenase